MDTYIQELHQISSQGCRCMCVALGSGAWHCDSCWESLLVGLFHSNVSDTECGTHSAIGTKITSRALDEWQDGCRNQLAYHELSIFTQDMLDQLPSSKLIWFFLEYWLNS